jgi:hypothetical protein
VTQKNFLAGKGSISKKKFLGKFYKNGVVYYFCNMCEKKKYKLQNISDGVIKCSKCDMEKDLSNFYFSRGYYDYKCKKCYSEDYLSKNGGDKKYKIQDIELGIIQCRTCGLRKGVEYYKKSLAGPYIYECVECTNNKNRNKRLQKKPIEEVLLFKEGFKICKVCNEVLPFDKFENKTPTRIRKSTCTKCIYHSNKNKEGYKERKKKSHNKWRKTEEGKKKVKEIAQRHDLKVLERNRIIREEKNKIREELIMQKEIEKEERNKIREEKKRIIEEKKLEKKKLMEYRKSNEWKEIMREKKRKNAYERWKRNWNENEMFALKVRLRNLIRNSFRRQGYKKFNTSTEKIVGMNYGDFKQYLQSRFVDGMSWENRGDWHIDHIIPLSSAKSEKELIRLCHYTNLQPLWGEDNMKKGDKIL